jgi:hypothetical protein
MAISFLRFRKRRCPARQANRQPGFISYIYGRIMLRWQDIWEDSRLVSLRPDEHTDGQAICPAMAASLAFRIMPNRQRERLMPCLTGP